MYFFPSPWGQSGGGLGALKRLGSGAGAPGGETQRPSVGHPVPHLPPMGLCPHPYLQSHSSGCPVAWSNWMFLSWSLVHLLESDLPGPVAKHPSATCTTTHWREKQQHAALSHALGCWWTSGRRNCTDVSRTEAMSSCRRNQGSRAFRAHNSLKSGPVLPFTEYIPLEDQDPWPLQRPWPAWALAVVPKGLGTSQETAAAAFPGSGTWGTPASGSELQDAMSAQLQEAATSFSFFFLAFKFHDQHSLTPNLKSLGIRLRYLCIFHNFLKISLGTLPGTNLQISTWDLQEKARPNKSKSLTFIYSRTLIFNILLHKILQLLSRLSCQ